MSVKDAEALALKNNPAISVARLSALASEQVTREVRSSLWPQAYGNLTAVDAREQQPHHRRGLNNPIVYTRAAGGATVSQLITDFGHTTNLVASARLQERADAQNAAATKAGRSAGRGSGLLQRSANARRAAGGGADCSLAAVVIGSGFRPHEKQIEVGPGPELCQRESGAGETPVSGRAEQRQGFRGGAFGDSRISHPRIVRAC